jgi:hypothetical protein
MFLNLIEAVDLFEFVYENLIITCIFASLTLIIEEI